MMLDVLAQGSEYTPKNAVWNIVLNLIASLIGVVAGSYWNSYKRNNPNALRVIMSVLQFVGLIAALLIVWVVEAPLAYLLAAVIIAAVVALLLTDVAAGPTVPAPGQMPPGIPNPGPVLVRGSAGIKFGVVAVILGLLAWLPWLHYVPPRQVQEAVRPSTGPSAPER